MTQTTIDPAFVELVQELLNDRNQDVNRTARYMRTSLSMGTLSECKDLVIRMIAQSEAHQQKRIRFLADSDARERK